MSGPRQFSIGDMAYHGLVWIADADAEVRDDLLIREITQKFETGDTPIVLWHPATTRVCALFRAGDGNLTFLSAGVTDATALPFAQGWAYPLPATPQLTAMGLTLIDVIDAQAKAEAIFGEQPRRYIGHSGGGAFASVFCHRNAATGRLRPATWLLTFGAPAAIAGTIPQLPVASMYLRMISEYDAVPGLPYDAHDLTCLGQATVVALNGPNYRPWNFTHGEVRAFVKGDGDEFYATSTACRSTAANTGDIIRWIRGTDGRSGFPHRSSTYRRRFSAELIDRMALDRLVFNASTVPDEPQEPPAIDLQAAIANEPERLNDVCAVVPGVEPLVEADVGNFPLPQFGGVSVENPQAFAVHTKKGRTVLQYGGIEIAVSLSRKDCERLARTLNRAVHEMGLVDMKPDAIAAVMQAVALDQVANATVMIRRRA